MPASQPAASERRNDKMTTPEPPKLKTTLKTPPKQATNPLQFVKVGPCALYRTAQEQLQKVEEVKKIKQEVREDPEDWQSNLDNWKSSRRKRQEHIIERVVEVKKLELEEHDRQRRRSKTFSEMMEERGSRGRKMSVGLAVYHEEDANDLSDLGIGTSSGKSSVSGDTHDDAHSVLSDRDSEIEKNHSDAENATSAPVFANGYHDNHERSLHQREYDSATTATASSPEPEEYTYEGAIRGYVSRVSQNIPRRAIQTHARDDGSPTTTEHAPVQVQVKVDILKRREIFESKASPQRNNNSEAKSSRPTADLVKSISVKERLSNLTKRKTDDVDDDLDKSDKNLNRLSGDMSSIRERLSHLERKTTEREMKNPVRPVTLQKYGETDKRAHTCCRENENRIETSTPSERSSSPDSEYRVARAPFHRSLDSLDTDASSGPDTFERVQSLEELDYTRRYTASSSSAELLNDTDREDSGIHTADVSCSVSQADDAVDEEAAEEKTEKPKAAPLPEAETLSGDPKAVTKLQESAETSGGLSTNKSYPRPVVDLTNTYDTPFPPQPPIPAVASPRPIVYQSPKVPPRKTPPTKALSTVEHSNPVVVVNVPQEIVAEGSSANNVVNLEETKTKPMQEEGDWKSRQKDSVPFPTFTLPTKGSSVSKIPTPLPRKTVTANSKSALTQPKARHSEDGGERATPSDHPPKSHIPVSIPQFSFPPAMIVSPNDRRHTVVELCEKVSLPQGETSVTTPFITIARLGDNENYEESVVNLEIVQESPVREMPQPPRDRKLVEEPAREEVSRPLTLDLQGKAPPPLTYEEMEIISPLSPVSQQILTLNLSSDEEIVSSSLAFPLGPPTSAEPPKEKPPPPPVDLSDEDESLPVEAMRRLNSTRRIKKELRTRRSDFLGIDGGNEVELEHELTLTNLTKPPDMAAILAEERRVQQLQRRSYDTDSNYEQDSSHERDSGVELGHAEDWTKQAVSPDMSQHSRQSSEPFGASVTSSEEDEITKKEREIIEVLEKEEQWRYGNSGEANCSSDIGEKLAHKLRELEEEKMQLERERAREVQETLRKNEANVRKREEETKELDNRDSDQSPARENKNKALQSAATAAATAVVVAATAANEPADLHEDDYASGDVLRVQRELLQLEQEEIERRRSSMVYREHKQLRLAEQLREQWKSMQDVVDIQTNTGARFESPPITYRSSMPNLQESQRRKPPPPPIPPAKPLRMIEQRQRDVTIRSSRMPSADSISRQGDVSLRHSATVSTLQSNHAGQQMTRQTLQALSAAPRPRIVQSDQWVQRRKSDIPRGAHDINYQHWLVQEAEQRRINEQNQRSPRKVILQSHSTGTSVPGYNVVSPPRLENGKPLPDSIIQTLTQRVQNRAQEKPLPPRRRLEHSSSHEQLSVHHQMQPQQRQQQQQQQQRIQQQITTNNSATESQEKMLSVSGKKKCSHCGDELGRGAAMIIESLRLFYHMECFKCCVCHVRLGDGRMGTDVRVRNHKLHCHNCYSSDDGIHI